MQLDRIKELVSQLGKPMFFYDTETTGLNDAGIVEIAWLKIDGDGACHQFESLVNPAMPIPEQASNIHGIYAKHVASAPQYKAVHAEFLRQAEDCIISGYNTRTFDNKVVLFNAGRYHLEKPEFNTQLDVRDIWIKVSGSWKGKLGDVALSYGVTPNGAHRAMSDVETTVNLLDKMIERHGMEFVVKQLIVNPTVVLNSEPQGWC